MSVNCVPESITKDVLFEKAQERFAHWAKLYGDPAVSAQHLYEDMSCSVFSGSPADDFQEECAAETPKLIDDCHFSYRGIIFRLTSDKQDDKEYIWCDKYSGSDELVNWVWGSFFIDHNWSGGAVILDKFIDSHDKIYSNAHAIKGDM